jgi:DNA repair protein RadC
VVNTLYVRDTSRRYRPAEENEILDLAADILAPRVIGQVLGSSRETTEYLRAKLARLEHEVFGCLYLDNRHRAGFLRAAFPQHCERYCRLPV